MLDEYDLRQLIKAKDIVDAVYNYNFGNPADKAIVSKLDTISRKIGKIIEVADKGGVNADK